MDMNKSLHQCYSWLNDFAKGDNSTLEDINHAFKTRNTGGILFIAILIVIGCIGNMHVLLIYSLKHKASNYRINILFLACLDMINCCVSMPLIIFYLNYPVMFPSEVFCKFFRFILYFVSIASASILTVIAADRHRKVCQSLKPQMTQFQTKTLCLSCLFLTLLLTWPVPVLYGDNTVFTGIGNLTGTRCFTEDDFINTKYQTIFNGILTLAFLCIATILTTMYYRIVAKLKKQRLKREAILSFDKSKKSRSKRRLKTGNTTITCFAVTMVYVFSALPHHILAILYFVLEDFDCKLSFIPSNIYYTFIWIFLVNNCANPIVYGFSDSRFRMELKRFYCRWKRFNLNIKVRTIDTTTDMSFYSDTETR